MEKHTSVVIVSYNTGASLWICVYRTLQLDGVKEVILVNNGNEAAVELRLRQLEQDNPRFTLVTGQGNVGFSKGCNLGASQATGDYILFLNPDAVMMDRDAPAKLAELFRLDTQPPIGLVGAILRNDDGSEQRSSRRNIITPVNALIEGSGLAKLRGLPLPVINLDHTPLPDNPIPIGAVSGACMMMERERFQQIGGFDEEYFLHVEDMDMCLRVYKAGGSVWVTPNVDVLHYRSTSQVQALFVERMKTKGFHRYFGLHYHLSPITRILAQIAVELRLGGKILRSLADEMRKYPTLTEAAGIRRVQAIVRGMNEVRGTEEFKGNGRTILVTGSSSTVGLFTIGRLLADGYRVVALIHKTKIGFFHPNLAWVQGDFEKPQELAENLQRFRLDGVIHCAPIWMGAPLLPMLSGIGAKKVIALSSTSLLTKKEQSSKAEKKVVEKLEAGEQAMREQAASLGLALTILRPTMVYGAGLDNNVARVAREFDEKGKFYLEKPAKGLRAPVHADDLALVAINAFNTPAADGQTYSVQGGENVSYLAMVDRIGKALGKPYRIKSIPQLASLCAAFHPLFPKKVPHPSLALRMQQNQIFPDPRIQEQLGVTLRPFLSGGIIDLGRCSESICRQLLNIYVENAVFFNGTLKAAPQTPENLQS
ncbi:MAG: glycosyltransferase [Alphaproteobacteria bacterium]|nr:glycosyltransferase [Alphaproteobacteria bacterium]